MPIDTRLLSQVAKGPEFRGPQIASNLLKGRQFATQQDKAQSEIKTAEQARELRGVQMEELQRKLDANASVREEIAGIDLSSDDALEQVLQAQIDAGGDPEEVKNALIQMRKLESEGLDLSEAATITSKFSHLYNAKDSVIDNLMKHKALNVLSGGDPDTLRSILKGTDDAKKKTGKGGKQPFSKGRTYIGAEGEFAGIGSFDKRTGETLIETPSGQKVPLSALPGIRPVTTSGLDKNVLTQKQFQDLTRTAKTEEQSVAALKRYMGTVESTEQGLSRMADSVMATFKTLFGQEIADPQQFATAISEGQQQPLIGRFRKEIVGGGVMTEQDAIRIVAALGGNPGVLLNKQVVAKLLGDLMEEKVDVYNTVTVPAYNKQIQVRKRGDFKPLKKIDAEFKFKKPDGGEVIHEGYSFPSQESLDAYLKAKNG